MDALPNLLTGTGGMGTGPFPSHLMISGPFLFQGWSVLNVTQITAAGPGLAYPYRYGRREWPCPPQQRGKCDD